VVATAEPAANLAGYDRPNLGTAYVAPTGEVERGLSEIWQELLGVRQVGVHDNFFELGGHSLLATQIVARVQKSFGVDLPLRAFTETPTPGELAQAIRALQGEGQSAPSITESVELIPDPDHRGVPFGLTDVQEAYWIGRSQVFQLGNVATHIYTEQDVDELDLDRYEATWQMLVDRHDMMRAIFLPDGRQQVLLDVPPFTIERIDLSDLDPEEQQRRLLELRGEMSHQVRPVDQWPIYEIRASVLGGGRHRLHVSFDFLIFDAWSFEIVAKEQALLYENLDAELPAIDLTFRDYVLAEEQLRQTEVFRRARQYWLDRIETMPPAPELPLARNPTEVTNPHFVGRNGVLPRSKWSLLKQRAERRGLTGTAFLAAVFSEVLATWCKTPRFTLNLTLFNRLPLHPHVDRILGDFSSLSLLGVEHQWGDTFEERAHRLQVQLWDDLDNRIFSGVRVMRELARDRGSLAHAMMPVVFTSTLGLVQQQQAQKPADEVEAIEDEPVDLDELGFRISQTPQVWIDHQVTELDGDLTIYWDAVEQLFDPGVLDAMFAANLA
ncbi:MAG: condensation domain-containing protein, partial [Acidobacteriota bacterium]